MQSPTTEQISEQNPKTKRKPVCGAHARSTGKPCQCLTMWRLVPTRCRLHGGLAGPATAAGKFAAWRNLKPFRSLSDEQLAARVAEHLARRSE